MIIFKKGAKTMKKRILALCLSAMFCLSVAAVQVTEDTTVSLTADSDTIRFSSYPSMVRPVQRYPLMRRTRSATGDRLFERWHSS